MFYTLLNFVCSSYIFLRGDEQSCQMTVVECSLMLNVMHSGLMNFQGHGVTRQHEGQIRLCNLNTHSTLNVFEKDKIIAL